MLLVIPYVISIYCHFKIVTSREAHEKEIILAIKETEERVRADAEQSLGLVRAKLVGTNCSYKIRIIFFMTICPQLYSDVCSFYVDVLLILYFYVSYFQFRTYYSMINFITFLKFRISVSLLLCSFNELGDKQEALMTLRREIEEKFQLERDYLNEKLKKALSELSTKSVELDTYSSEGKTVSENLKSMQRIMDSEAVSKRNEISELKDLLETSKNDKTKLLVKLEDVKLSNSKLEQILNEKESYISEQDDLRLNLEGDVKQLRDDLARYVRMCTYVRSMSPYILP